ncbi:MAG: hypothetical protein AAGE94_18810 [Acidobacteriota bacterium]
MTATQRIERFLRASDPDTAAEACCGVSALDSEARATVGRVLDDWEDPQAIANLLMCPSMVPAERRVDTFLRGLGTSEPRYWVLAAAVGLRRLDSDTLTDDERRRLADRLVAVAWRQPEFAVHATAVLGDFLDEPEALPVFALLEHADNDVRHNALACLVTTVGLYGVGHFTRVAEASGIDPQTREAAVRRLRRHLERADAGRATPDAWLIHGAVPTLAELDRPRVAGDSGDG